MSLVDTKLTNTILIPASDSLVDSGQLKDSTIVKDITKFNTNFKNEPATTANQFSLYFQDKGKSVKAAFCQQVRGLKVSRIVEAKRSGGNADYIVRLPGALDYGEIEFVQLYTDNEVFLDWLINGADQGGIKKADIEIRVGTDKNYVVYTLRDAFPISWNFGTMSINVEGLVTGKSTLTYSIKSGEILVENIGVAYGKLEFASVKAGA